LVRRSCIKPVFILLYLAINASVLAMAWSVLERMLAIEVCSISVLGNMEAAKVKCTTIKNADAITRTLSN